MSFILNIDTATETAHVAVAANGQLIAQKDNRRQQDHASFLHPAINDIVNEAGITLAGIDAVAVSYGPGSYTGIRVGMAAAKGLCYVLNKPLITVNSLDIIAKDMILHAVQQEGTQLYCPMIDARRMEVYTAVYNSSLEVVMPAEALILDNNSFEQLLKDFNISFSGSGAAKWQRLCVSENALFTAEKNTTLAMALLSAEKLAGKAFSDVAYVEPLYLKAFYTTQPGAMK